MYIYTYTYDHALELMIKMKLARALLKGSDERKPGLSLWCFASGLGLMQHPIFTPVAEKYVRFSFVALYSRNSRESPIFFRVHTQVASFYRKQNAPYKQSTNTKSDDIFAIIVRRTGTAYTANVTRIVPGFLLQPCLWNVLCPVETDSLLYETVCIRGLN